MRRTRQETCRVQTALTTAPAIKTAPLDHLTPRGGWTWPPNGSCEDEKHVLKAYRYSLRERAHHYSNSHHYQSKVAPQEWRTIEWQWNTPQAQSDSRRLSANSMGIRKRSRHQGWPSSPSISSSSSSYWCLPCSRNTERSRCGCCSVQLWEPAGTVDKSLGVFASSWSWRAARDAYQGAKEKLYGQSI